MPPKAANCIFEYLTNKNPEVVFGFVVEKSLSKSDSWIYPRQLKQWDDFNFNTMEEIFDRELMKECLLPRALDYPAPALLPRELLENSEDATLYILSRWTLPMVSNALESVKSSFHPVVFVPSSRAARGKTTADSDLYEAAAPPGGRSRLTRTARQIRPRKRSSTRTIRPEGMGDALSELERSFQNPPSSKPELPESRLAVDIKPGSKWDSSELFNGEILDDNGIWKRSKVWSRCARPIRQIYTYCVYTNARYGCILSCREAFIVRIKARKTSGREDICSTGHHRLDKPEEAGVKQSMTDNGLMEYISIPWSNHRGNGSVEDYKDLTVNFALWVLHILAGNGHKIDWDYGPLKDERLRKEKGTGLEEHNECSQVSDSSYQETQQESVRRPLITRCLFFFLCVVVVFFCCFF